MRINIAQSCREIANEEPGEGSGYEQSNLPN